jgi:hypothetical protein
VKFPARRFFSEKFSGSGAATASLFVPPWRQPLPPNKNRKRKNRRGPTKKVKMEDDLERKKWETTTPPLTHKK